MNASLFAAAAHVAGGSSPRAGSEEVVALSIRSSFWNFFASLRLTVFVLLTLAFTSIIGTLVPQMGDPAEYVRRYGAVLHRVLSVLDLYDMYHAWWFQLLLVLLVLNVVVCSIDRLKATWNILFGRQTGYRPTFFGDPELTRTLTLPEAPADLQRRAVASARPFLRAAQPEALENGFRYYGELGRWTRLGVYGVHLSVVLLLLGGLIGSLFGFEGFVNIPEGASVDRIRLRASGGVLALPFTIRCDDFNVQFYPSGAPSEFRSRLTLLEDGREVLQRDIIVNDPLRYRGINLFQSSYGQTGAEAATLTFASRDSGMEYSQRLRLGESAELPENGGRFTLQRYSEHAEFRGHPVGEALIGTLVDGAGQATELILPLRFPSFDRMRRGAWTISVTAHEGRQYTGLQVTSDPGVALVYAGFIMMIAGCFVTFFMSHQRLSIEIQVAAEGSRVVLSGAANKNRLAMQRRVQRLAERFAHGR
jgi:cytochrome c biogenesis protein